MEIEEVDISSIVPSPNNMRKHGEENIASIMASLSEFGQQKPIVVGEEDKVLAGHGTLEAAKRLGWEKIFIVRSELKDAKSLLYMVADNRTTDLSEWDEEMLVAAFCDAQKQRGVDLTLSGFDAGHIEKLVSVGVGNEMSEFARGMVAEETSEPVGLRKAVGDGNYIYVEWYGDDAAFQRVMEALRAQEVFVGHSKHEIDPRFFEKLIGIEYVPVVPAVRKSLPVRKPLKRVAP